MARCTIAVVLAFVLLPAAAMAADTITYQGETPSSGKNVTLSSNYTSHSNAWDYCYDLYIGSNTSGDSWAIKTPYNPVADGGGTLTNTPTGTWTWQWVSSLATSTPGYYSATMSSLLGDPVMMANSTSSLFTGSYYFQFWDPSEPPVPQLYSTRTTDEGTTWGNPEPGTIGMVFLVMGVAGLLRRRRK